MTTMTLPGRLMRPVATPPARRATLIGFGATLVLGLLIAAAVSAGMGVASARTIVSAVSVGGVEVSGLTPDAAAARLTAELPSLTSGKAVLVIGEEEIAVPYADIGRRYETGVMIDAAFGIGRDGNLLADGLARLRSLAHPTVLPVVVQAYDPVALEQVSRRIADQLTVPAGDASVVAEGSVFMVVPSEAGLSVDAAAVHDRIAAAIDSIDPADVRVEVVSTIVPPAVTTAEAEGVAQAARSTVEAMALEIPGAGEDGEPLSLSSETIASWLSFGPGSEAAYALHVDEAAVTAAIAGFVEAVDQDAINARIGVVAGGGLGGVTAGQDGRELDIVGTQQALLAALDRRGRGANIGSLALTVSVIEPALTTAEAEEMLPQMQLVTSWTTTYVPGDGNGFGANISIGAWDIDGYNLAPGEWFSFWGGIGPVTTERGYTYGGAIINGRSVARGALAGGICSTSTTLFNAAMRFGLEIGERDNHYYYIDRYPTGLDATVAIVDDSVKDLTFRNDTEHPIVIRGFGSPGQVTFQMWSVPNGRTVAISDPYITNQRGAIETTQVSRDLAPGSARRVEYPHDGFDVSVSRTVTAADGTVVHQNTWFSDYRPVNGITLTGPTPAVAAVQPPAEAEDEADGQSAEAPSETPAP
ncbi:MAG: VanW family protein [Candidatus Limnocylindria bacterium]